MNELKIERKTLLAFRQTREIKLILSVDCVLRSKVVIEKTRYYSIEVTNWSSYDVSKAGKPSLVIAVKLRQSNF